MGQFSAPSELHALARPDKLCVLTMRAVIQVGEDIEENYVGSMASSFEFWSISEEIILEHALLGDQHFIHLLEDLVSSDAELMFLALRVVVLIHF